MDNAEFISKRREEVADAVIRGTVTSPFDRGYADYTRQPLPTKAARACVQSLMACHGIGKVLRELDGFDRISLVEQWSDYIEENPTEKAVQLILNWETEIVAKDVSVDNGQVWRERWNFKIIDQVDGDIQETLARMLSHLIDKIGAEKDEVKGNAPRDSIDRYIQEAKDQPYDRVYAKPADYTPNDQLAARACMQYFLSRDDTGLEFNPVLHMDRGYVIERYAIAINECPIDKAVDLIVHDVPRIAWGPTAYTDAFNDIRNTLTDIIKRVRAHGNTVE